MSSNNHPWHDRNKPITANPYKTTNNNAPGRGSSVGGGASSLSREAQVLERQRQMADRIAGISSTAGNNNDGAVGSKQQPPAKPPPPPSAPSSAGSKKSNTTSEQQRRILHEKARREKLNQVFGNNATDHTNNNKSNSNGNRNSNKPNNTAHKRPAPPPTKATANIANNTAETVLAQARQRAGVTEQQSSAATNNNNNPSTNATTTTAAANPCKKTYKRATMRRNVGGNSSSSAGAATIRTSDATSTAIAKQGTHATTATGGGGGGSLATLLRSNIHTAKYLGPNAPKLLQQYDRIEPNDYWKNMREWNFLKELNDRVDGSSTSNNHQFGNGGGGKRKRGNQAVDSNNNNPQNNNQQQNNQTQQTQKEQPPAALPNTFQSYRQYCALWAPLCLEEARAQLLSEAMTEIPYWRSKPDKAPIRVGLQPLTKDLDGSSENLGVQVKQVLGSGGGSGGKGKSFIANDVVLLVKEEAFIWAATRGNLGKRNNNNNNNNNNNKSNSNASDDDNYNHRSQIFGIIGQVEYTRRSIEGLTLQVSRKLWSQIGTTEMTLLKIGCNITALREFTALCRMDQIPLLDHILGQKMTLHAKKEQEIEEESTAIAKIGHHDEDVDPLKIEYKAKKEILSNIGGDAALGKGFADYARHKFNLSQLGAIASSAKGYGGGGFTLIKGPPGTGKTTTLCALLNALHIRQMNQYFGVVKVLAESLDAVVGKRAALSLASAAKKRPRILVCAPSNAAVDNVILKIMEDGFVDGNGCRYNPQIVRIGVGKSDSVKDVCLEEKVDAYISDAMDMTKLDNTIEGYKAECRRIHTDIAKLRQRMNAIKNASPYPLAKNWEIRVDEETFNGMPRVYFVNHKDKSTTYETPPPPEPGERHFPARAMPEYKAFVSKVVKMTERYNGISTKLERYCLCQNAAVVSQGGSNNQAMNNIRQQLETHILDSVHIVMTTLGTAGNRALEAANKFEVVVIDEAAQSVEPSTLAGLQLGSKHAILVGDPQQLPATIFSVSGRNTKYDRSLFQRLEEAGHDVHMLNTQYRMHPAISDFPRRIFYDGKLMDGPNVKHPEYGNPLKRAVFKKFQHFQPLTVLDLESSEERGGTSLSNPAEAQLALHLFNSLKNETGGLSTKSRVAVITPYAQQAGLLRRTFSNSIGPEYERFVEVNTVDAFQGREANIVIFSCVRAAGSRGIGFLSDVRRMNVALTRAKHFLFVIARCSSIVVNPYWRDLVEHARETDSIIEVPMSGSRQSSFCFPDLKSLQTTSQKPNPIAPVDRKKHKTDSNDGGEGGSFKDALSMLNSHAEHMRQKAKNQK